MFQENLASSEVEISAGSGGGAYMEDSTANMTGCTFWANRVQGKSLFAQFASYGGGATVRGDRAMVNFSDTTFEANEAARGGSGGGLWVEGGAGAVLQGCAMRANGARSSYTHKGAGGGASVSGDGFLSMEACVMEGNMAGPEAVEESEPGCLSGDGGAVHSSGASMSLRGVHFTQNACQTGSFDGGCSGGAVSLTGHAATATNAGEEGLWVELGHGGGQAGEGLVEGCTFEGNEARGSGSYSVYSGAGQGGAVAVRFATPLFVSTTFSNNSAHGGGGGSAPSTGGAVLLFLSRQGAQGSGKGKDGSGGGKGRAASSSSLSSSSSSTPPTFVNCTFNGNQAGGGTMGKSSMGVSNQDAHGIGGALAAIASSPLLQGCTFSSNRALAVFPTTARRSSKGETRYPTSAGSPSFGGAIVITSDSAGTRLEGCSLHQNVAAGGVGGDLAVLASSGARCVRDHGGRGNGGGGLIPWTNCSVRVMLARCVLGRGSREGGCAFNVGGIGPLLGRAPILWGKSLWDNARLPGEHNGAPRSRVKGDGGGDATVVMLGCTFSPALPQEDPPLPWADGRSETSESPFIFLLDGGRVELQQPVFLAHGQVFVAQVRLLSFGRARPKTRQEGAATEPWTGSSVQNQKAHQQEGAESIVDGRKTSAITHPNASMWGEEISVVSYHARVTVSSGMMGQGLGEGGVPDRPEPLQPPAGGQSSVKLGLRELILLGGALELNGSDLAMSGSTRLRACSIVKGGEVSGRVGKGLDGAWEGSDGDAQAEAVLERLLWQGQRKDQGLGEGGRPPTAELTGPALLSLTWEPKPFFLDTSLAPLFRPLDPAPSPAPVVAPAPGLHGDRPGAADGTHAWRQDDVETPLTLDGVLLRLQGVARVHGGVRLAGGISAVVVSGNPGSLKLTGDTAMRRWPSPTKAPPTQGSPGAANDNPGAGRHSAELAPLVNNGLLTLPRGSALSVAGGIEQGASGSAVLTLPPPLFSPTDSQGDGGRRGSGEAVGGDTGGGHLLVVESGTAKLGGTVTATVVGGGGGEDAERIKMHRRWAVARFESPECAAAADMSGLSVSAPTGVTMSFSMEPIMASGQAESTPTGSGPSPPHLGAEPGAVVGPVVSWSSSSAPEHSAGHMSEMVLEVTFIECSSMVRYANLTWAGGPCQACLLNLDCAWCGQDKQGCIPKSEVPPPKQWSSHATTCQMKNCCPGGCNGVGTCDFRSAVCTCSWLYSGASCKELSTRGAVALSLSLSALALLLLTLACGRSSRRKQMEAVVDTLHELRRGLLSERDGSSMGDEDSQHGGARGNFGETFSSSGRPSFQHMWPRDYIQNLQQNLALRDVMVSFDELNLAGKIGCGSSGSVWRGTWRGAAVAVKACGGLYVIRRPFHQPLELTGQDLEKFKREAYLMSRCGLSSSHSAPKRLLKNTLFHIRSIDLRSGAVCAR
ncbi:unnamed protein product [Discosporangium mesarthrocarpum]